MDYLNSNGIKVFNIHDAAKIFGKPEKYVSMRLTAMSKIKRATRGIYYVHDAEVSEIATKIVVPSYISLISAFPIAIPPACLCRILPFPEDNRAGL